MQSSVHVKCHLALFTNRIRHSAKFAQEVASEHYLLILTLFIVAVGR